jgi:hypothetical protein
MKAIWLIATVSQVLNVFVLMVGSCDITVACDRGFDLPDAECGVADG